MCTAITARVRGVILPATSSTDRFGASQETTSASTGTAPTYRGACAVARNVNAGTITSSPGPNPNEAHARCNAAVPEDTATAYGDPVHSATAASNAAVRGPMVSQPERRHSATAARSSSAICTSVSGTAQVTPTPQPARPPRDPASARPSPGTAAR